MIARIPVGFKDFQVRGIACNSKLIDDDFIFVAVKGNKEDGNEFIPEAIARGAKAVIYQSPGRQDTKISGRIPFIKVKDARKALAKLASEFYANPSSLVKVTGVTGTNGKTTVTYLIEALLKEANLSPAVIGTINYRFKNEVIVSKNTTPGPLELQGMLKNMADKGVDSAVMEVSSHALDQDRTMGINFSSAIFTNLTQDHLDYHKTMQDYFLAKAKLFKGLREKSASIINTDDKYGQRLKRSIRGKRVITYGIRNKADLKALDIRMNINGAEFTLKGLNNEFNLKTRLVGRHNIYNILAAVGWAISEGLSVKIIRGALEKFTLVPGRLEKIDSPKGFSVFVDYAHTDDALKNVITTLRQLTDKKIIVVFGCGGDRDKTKRPKMGRVVSRLADQFIITNDNPRSEDPEVIISDIKKGILNSNYLVLPDRKKAINKAISLASSGDIVLVAGKGHENYQILKDKIISFNDREIVKECLA
ncbi:MAG: UDP-N-acetylmuramoyl-L-alanyl-D-glutamate--2,6-diaminopimelate ligase [Candidatus Omnitrophica bacterium]|nr:UDP-N-acetylmuramoyl-L-alanyl-D-glutamate--2,6-diaminopimelate ligase [Candidatus Omnitrophota bacterium]MBU2035817.1 UDP-N-acetylmuramoyl-L-alanyl-D-glutamate--2,6-diaminopimelate ligase [Candidatus Omnitrophota bacterium]